MGRLIVLPLALIYLWQGVTASQAILATSLVCRRWGEGLSQYSNYTGDEGRSKGISREGSISLRITWALL
jgi:hypothetical protein